MAFKGPIDLEDGGDSLSLRIASAYGAGLTVSGTHVTAGNFRNWAALSVFVTAFTSKRTAQAVFKKSQRHVPVDTGDLFKSGFAPGINDNTDGEFSKATVIDENIEGTVAAYVKGLAVSGTLTAPSGFFGARVFTKYAVGYTDQKAAVVHENPFGQVWRNDSPNREFPDPKTDHFLLNAYNAYKYRYSAAMILGLKEVEKAIGAIAVKQANALSSGAGKPRLVRH